jgi:hypothetical protein
MKKKEERGKKREKKIRGWKIIMGRGNRRRMIKVIICRINRISFLIRLIMVHSNSIKRNNNKFNNQLHNNKSKINKTHKITNSSKNFSLKESKALESITIINLIISLTIKLKCWLIRNKKIKQLIKKTFKFKNLNGIIKFEKIIMNRKIYLTYIFIVH